MKAFQIYVRSEECSMAHKMRRLWTCHDKLRKRENKLSLFLLTFLRRSCRAKKNRGGRSKLSAASCVSHFILSKQEWMRQKRTRLLHRIITNSLLVWYIFRKTVLWRTKRGDGIEGEKEESLVIMLPAGWNLRELFTSRVNWILCDGSHKRRNIFIFYHKARLSQSVSCSWWILDWIESHFFLSSFNLKWNVVIVIGKGKKRYVRGTRWERRWNVLSSSYKAS